jgi:FkbM family methyltransferase
MSQSGARTEAMGQDLRPNALPTAHTKAMNSPLLDRSALARYRQPMQHKVVALEGGEVTFAGRAGDPYFDHLGDHDNSMLLDAIALLPSDAIIFDVGANIGLTTAVMTKRLPNARILSFEPDPEPFGYLFETVRLNNFLRVETVNKALADAPGRMAFHSHPRGAGASHLASDQSLRDGNETVEVSTVDIERAGHALARVDLIKIDVEGFEIDVLEGARDTIAADRPYIALEFNSFTMIAFRNLNPRTMLEKLIREFPYVYRRKDGALARLSTAAEQFRFLHDNLVYNGCVDDLLCSWREIG